MVYPDHAVHRSGEGAPASGTVWRPQAIGIGRTWRAAVRSVYEVPPGVVPHLTRHPDLAEDVTVVLETEGAALPTPPRNRAMGWWLVAAAVAVAAIQFGSGAWRLSFAVVPWTILVSGALICPCVGRTPPSPGRASRAGSRPGRVAHCVAAGGGDLAAAPPFRAGGGRSARAAGRGRSPSDPALYGDEPFHLAVMESVLDDGDIDLGNNLDLEAHPQEAVFDKNGDLLHSPVLGALLLPGFAAAGRTGALLLLALDRRRCGGSGGAAGASTRACPRPGFEVWR